ncbi:MAG TPA: hypothetical protein VD978_33240 [Azospirillum sp.]|nr:hypothetical protein [Azospirillum sp.]
MAEHEPFVLSMRPKCCYCGELLLPGQPRWAGDLDGNPWHYACAEKAKRTTRQLPLSYGRKNTERHR